MHSPAGVWPDRDDRAGQTGGTCAHLQLSTNLLLIGGRLVLERTIDGNDDHVLPLLAQVCNLETGHRTFLLYSITLQSFGHSGCASRLSFHRLSAWVRK